MSGVAKDDTNPTQPSDDTVSAVGAAEAGQAEAPTEPAQASKEPSKEETESRASRRNAPHLRVVSDNDPEFVAPLLPDAVEAPHQRIGTVIRAARENAGFTLEQVSKETRVHLSHLRAIEDMRPGQLGAPVYAKGYIKAYARFLGLDEQNTLDRFLSECAILKDPEKQDIAPPATTKTRQLPVAIPVLGILVVGLVGAGVAFLMMNGDKQQPAAAPTESTSIEPSTTGAAGTATAPLTQQLRIVALKRGMLEVRSAKGDKYVHRYYEAGEFFPVRIGAGWTVSAEDGAAFEWKLGDQSLGLLQPEGGQVYSQNVDLAAQRTPIAAPIDPQLTHDIADPAAITPSTGAPQVGVTGAAPAPPKPRTTPKPAATTPATGATTPPVAQSQPQTKPPATQQPAAPVRDPALAAYPDQ